MMMRISIPRLLFAVALLSAALTNAAPPPPADRNQTHGTNDAWLADMSIFVKEVDRVASQSTMPPEEPWTVGGTLVPGLKRSGIILSKTGVGEVGVIPGKGGMDGEFGTELLKRFPSGHVKWHGIVKSAKLDEESKAHLLVVPFPAPPASNSYDIQPLTVKITFGTLPRDRAPKEGALFAFEGDLKGEKQTMYENSVDVIYWFSKAELQPGANRVWVIVSVSDAKPLSPEK